MYKELIKEFPYMESSIRDYSKKFLLESLQYSDVDKGYFFEIRHMFLLDELYKTLHDLFDNTLPTDLSLEDRWNNHLSLEEVLVRENIIYETEQPGTWMEHEYDYPTEEMINDGFLDTDRFDKLMKNIDDNWPIHLSKEDFGI